MLLWLPRLNQTWLDKVKSIADNDRSSLGREHEITWVRSRKSLAFSAHHHLSNATKSQISSCHHLQAQIICLLS